MRGGTASHRVPSTRSIFNTERKKERDFSMCTASHQTDKTSTPTRHLQPNYGPTPFVGGGDGAAAAAERSTTDEPGYYSFLHTSTNKCSNVWSAHLDLTRRRTRRRAATAAACLTWLPTCKMCYVRLRSRLRKMSSNDSANLEMFSFIIFLFSTESAELLFLPVSSMNLSGGFLNRPCTTVSTQHTTAAAFLIGTYWINVHAFKNCDATRPHRFMVGCAGRTIRDESHNYIDNRMITSQLNRFTVKELKDQCSVMLARNRQSIRCFCNSQTSLKVFTKFSLKPGRQGKGRTMVLVVVDLVHFYYTINLKRRKKNGKRVWRWIGNESDVPLCDQLL